MSSTKIKQAVDEIKKRFGDGAIMSMDGTVPVTEHARLPTSVGDLDEALGIGGLPRGRLVEVFGPEGSGKTALALQIAAAVQRDPGPAGTDGVVAWIDVVHDLEPKWATALGVDMARLLVSQPDNGEQALEIVETLVRSGAVSLVIIDDVGGLRPRAELEGEDRGINEGLQARLMSQAMRKLTGHAARSGTTLVFLSQTRTAQQPGLATTALKFYASVRLALTRQPTTRTVSVHVVKNKMAPPFREATFELPAGTVTTDAVHVAEIVTARLEATFRLVQDYTQPASGGGWSLQHDTLTGLAHVRDADEAVVCTPRPALQVCNWLDGFIAAWVAAGGPTR